jgi:hypothetical protein
MSNEPTRMDKDLHLKLVAAWWDGELEFFYAEGGWKTANRTPHSESEISRYRIRPKPTLRPWKPEEVPLGAQIKLKGSKTIRHLLVCTTDHEIEAGQAFRGPHKWAFDECVHSLDNGKTWLPCGVEESR